MFSLDDGRTSAQSAVVIGSNIVFTVEKCFFTSVIFLCCPQHVSSKAIMAAHLIACRLTAFVLRSFSQARRFIFVDEEELKATTAWITKHQQPNGCFPKVGRLFNKRMKVRIPLNSIDNFMLQQGRIVLLIARLAAVGYSAINCPLLLSKSSFIA